MNLVLILIFLLSIFHITSSNIVQIQSTLTNTNAGNLSILQFFRQIFFIYQQDIFRIINSQSIETYQQQASFLHLRFYPLILQQKQFYFFYVYEKILFNQNFDLSRTVPSVGLYSNFTVDSVNNIVQLKYTNISQASNVQINFTLANVTNPFVSSLFQAINLNVKNNMNSLIDQGELSLTYTTSTFSLINDWEGYFQPGNVGTISNFTFNFKPNVWKNGKMSLTLGFNRFWTRSLQNTSSTNIISSSTKCQPSCSISSKSTFTQIQFSALSLNSNNSIQLKIVNILSPPTLQKVDVISVTSYDTTYISTIQTGSSSLASSKANQLQNLAVSTASQINQPINLVIDLTTANAFGPNDTMNIYFSQQILSSAIKITLQNGIVPSYTSDIISKNQILFSGFTILSSSYSKMTFKITLQNALNQTRSSKLILLNKISIKRNGYLYNQQTFSFSVQPVMYAYPLKISINNNFVNFNSTMNLNLVSVTEKFINGDVLKIRIPQQINVYSGSCIPLQCIGCLCSVQVANQSTTESVVTITNFPSQGVNFLNLNLQIRNPISTGYTINTCHYDVSNYLIQCFKGDFPQVQQTTLSSKIIVLQNSNDQVYQISNYTLKVNLTNYDLNPGYMLILFQKNLYLVNSSIIVCYVNGQPVCDLKSNTTTDQLVIKFLVTDVSVKMYTVKIENIRNPLSTQPFQFSLRVFSVYFDSSTNKFVQLKYYSADSTYYRVTKPFELTNIISSINPCQNGKLSTLSLLIANNSLPFDPKYAILIDNPQPENLSILRKTINQQILWNPTMMNVSIQNYISLEPIGYSFLVKTIDLLYDIFSFQITIKNCQPSSLAINSWRMVGLLGDTGQLSFVYSNTKPVDYLVVQIPLEYSNSTQMLSNALSTTKLSPRTYKLTLSSTQPISIQIWNFTHLSKISSFFRFTTYKTSSINSQDYVVDQNSNIVYYNLTMISSCTFPCKICSANNFSVCLQCYSKQFTQNYLLVNGTCLSQCASGFYYSSTVNNCLKCNSTCLTCDESKCLTCVQYYYYLNGSCLTDCPDKYFPISITQTCSKCSYPCDKCVNSTLCITCISPLYLNSNGNCVQDCASNQYPINLICRKCETPCQSCSQALNNCTKCVEGYYYYQNKCITVCPSPLVPSTVSKVCTTCISSCITCSISPTTCTSCQSPLKLYQSQCVNICPTGYYETLNGNNSLCTLCPSECSVCSSQSNCSICAKSYKYFNNKCISVCPLMYFSQTINSTTNSLLNGTQICSPCTNDNRCIKCQNQLQCSLCATGYYLLSNVCVSSCPVTMFQDSFSCKNCSASCLYCASSDICQICSSSTFLYQQKCLTQCPVNTTWKQITKNISSSVSTNQTTQKTLTCVSCSQAFLYCSTCTNTSCTVCNSNYVLDFDNSCKLKCSQGYINLNNKGYCIKCASQCIECTNQLNNCTQCSSGFTLYISSNSSSSNFRQCLMDCPNSMIKYLGKCTQCQSPCKSCIDNPNKCLSCITSNTSYYLFNSTCLTQCPYRYYPFQSTCQQCDPKCQRCRKQGCLQCASGYFTSQPFNITNSDNSISTYYYCYQKCPQTLPFVYNNTCKKCSQNCVSCNSNRCLECEINYYIYGVYCVRQCPLPLVNYSASCVNVADIPVPPTPNNTVVVEQKVQPTYFSFPVPFSMVLFIIIIVCLLSKCQYPSTQLFVAFYGTGSILCTICIIFYFITFNTKDSSLSGASILLLIGLIINYVQNFIFLILLKFTLLIDESFKKFKIAHKQYLGLFLVGFLTTHSNYILFFSKLFDMSIFKVYLQNINYLKILNYLWFGQILVYLLGWISGIIRISTINRYSFTLSQTLEHFYQCLDLIIVCFITFLMSLLNYKKTKQVYLRQDDIVSTESTKKVIFDESSNQQINDYQSRQEFNIRGKNFRISNQNILFDKLIYPEESGNKFLFQENYQNEENENYDEIFAKNYSFYDGKINKNNNDLAVTKDQLLSGVLEEKSNEQQKINRKKQIAQNFAVSNTINLQVKQNQMTEDLENIPVVHDQNQEKEANIFENYSALSHPRQALQIQRLQEVSQDQTIFQQNQSNQNQASLSKVIQQPQEQEIAAILPPNQVSQQQQTITIDDKHLLQINSNNDQRQLSIEPTRVEYSVNQNQNLNEIKDQIQNSNLLANIQSAQNLIKKKSLLNNSLKSISSHKKSPNKSESKSPVKNVTKSIQVSPKVIKESPTTIKGNKSSLSIKKNSSLISSKQKSPKKQENKSLQKQKSLQKSLNKDNNKKVVEVVKKQNQRRKRYNNQVNKQKSPKKEEAFVPGHLFSPKKYRERHLQPRISGIGVLFNSFMQENNSKLLEGNPTIQQIHKIQQQTKNHQPQNLNKTFQPLNNQNHQNNQNNQNHQIINKKHQITTQTNHYNNFNFTKNIKNQQFQQILIEDPITHQNQNQFDLQNYIKEKQKNPYINEIEQYCLKPEEMVQIVGDLENRSRDKSKSKEKFKKISIEKSSKSINLNNDRHNSGRGSRVERTNNINKRQQNSQQEQYNDTKFYLNDGLKNYKIETNNPSSTHRRSKSFSPNNHFNRTTNKLPIEKRYKQQPKPTSNKHLPVHNLSTKTISIDVIDYQINKNNNKKQNSRQATQKAQNLSHTINQIQRKQRIKTKSRQLENIYGNKVINKN